MTPILSLILALQAAQPPASLPDTEEGRAAVCQAEVRRDPAAALAQANRWQTSGGGLHARQCAGLAYAALERWPAAAGVFEQAAQEAERAHDNRSSDFWVQAGNAWLAGGEPARAVNAFDAALGRAGALSPQMQGEVRLDRARALVAQNQLAPAREDMNRALELVPGDPMVWYLSAALARRQNDLVRARTDIGRARELSHDDPDILLLAGTIAGAAGDMAEAERLYREVVRRAPNSDAGRSASATLAGAHDVEVAAPAATPTPPPPAPRERD
jgi:tetratricopeptide (TPR) repeat protein